MSLYTDPQDQAFALISSEEERQAIMVFIDQHQRFFERLSGVFANAPVSIKDGSRILDKLVFVTVDANSLSMARKRPKNRRVPDWSRRVTFVLGARDAGEHGTLAMMIASAVGTMSDYCGIQARGGCACAGPYAHRLLAISKDDSIESSAAIWRGQEFECQSALNLDPVSASKIDPHGTAVARTGAEPSRCAAPVRAGWLGGRL